MDRRWRAREEGELTVVTLWVEANRVLKQRSVCVCVCVLFSQYIYNLLAHLITHLIRGLWSPSPSLFRPVKYGRPYVTGRARS